MKALMVIAAMAIGNFFYQWMTQSDWETAFERSYFQAIAILIYAYLA